MSEIAEKTDTVVEPILSVRDLKLHYFTQSGVVRALDGISFDVMPGEALGLVGESGCGKTTAGLALLNMPTPPGKIVGGSVKIDGVDILGLSDSALRKHVRWSKISMVFQGAMNCLTPVFTIRTLMRETWMEHLPDKTSVPKNMDSTIEKYVQLMGLPVRVLDRYPHELSGGMKQRVVIAMSLFLEPKVIIMDEPTTALDVIVQAQILNLIKSLKKQLKICYIFITHDLATEAEVADRLIVMYAGRIAEIAHNRVFFSEKGPAHPYSQKLLASTPRLKKRVSELAFIPGAPPDLCCPPVGCHFSPRCSFAKQICIDKEPPLVPVDDGGHLVACWKAIEDPEYVRE